MIKERYPVANLDGISIKTFYDSVTKTVYLWRDYTKVYPDGTKYNQQWALGEIPYDENFVSNLSEIITNVSLGYVRCSYCGKWIPIEESFHFVPAGCTCRDCYDKGVEGEKEFLSMCD